MHLHSVHAFHSRLIQDAGRKEASLTNPPRPPTHQIYLPHYTYMYNYTQPVDTKVLHIHVQPNIIINFQRMEANKGT